MSTTKEYDESVERKLRELREPHQNAWKGQAPIGSMEMPTSQEPKRRGRPPGSKNKPKA